MEQKGLDRIFALGEKKLKYSKNYGQYTVYAMLAGAYCTIGMALAYSAGAGAAASPGVAGMYKFVIGAMFTLAFTLIMFSGAELFTGNVMVMTVGLLGRKTRLGEASSLLCRCYFANLLGAALMGIVITATGLLNGTPFGDLIVESCAAKMTLAFWPAFFRGIMCNILICLGTWVFVKLENEVAKMIILFWVIVGFVTPGYEHSVANAALFTMGLFTPQKTEAVSLLGAVRNLVPVTLGNIAGGAVFVGLAYWFAGSEKKLSGGSM